MGGKPVFVVVEVFLVVDDQPRCGLKCRDESVGDVFGPVRDPELSVASPACRAGRDCLESFPHAARNDGPRTSAAARADVRPMNRRREEGRSALPGLK